jgi:MarR family transcriptional regulator for hemolysin
MSVNESTPRSTSGADGRDVPIGRRLAMTAKSVRAYTEDRLAESGSTLSIVIVARILSLEPGLSQRQIADRMHLQSPTVMRHLERMEVEGLIARERDDRDRRVQRITLTEDGRRMLDRLEVVAASVDESLTSVFEPDGLVMLEGLLDRLAVRARTLREQGAEEEVEA